MIRTRFAPSPTGFLHIGNLRSAVYPYAMARHNHGQFILRIEDTDRDRAIVGGVDAIKNTLTKFGITWDEYYVQSERKETGIYAKAVQKLLDESHAFFCQCSAKNAKQEGFSNQLRDPCRDKDLTSGAIKLKVPDNETVSYHDFIVDKDISWDTNTVYDATLLKTDGFPTYHLAAMTDDLDMNISHIIRGHDWMPSTPIHLLVLKYLGGDRPKIGHLTDILSPKGGKLSKRHDSVFCEQFLEDGYLPEALLNFVILLGWAPKDNRELFTLSEFVEAFDFKGFQKSNPLFTFDKLNWFNGQYIRQKSDEELAKLLNADPKIINLIKDRLVRLSDFETLTSFLRNAPLVDATLFSENSIQHLNFAVKNLDNLTVDLVKRQGFKVGDFYMSLRIAICGSKFTPPITDVINILGKEETVSRINSALNSLKKLVLPS